MLPWPITQLTEPMLTIDRPPPGSCPGDRLGAKERCFRLTAIPLVPEFRRDVLDRRDGRHARVIDQDGDRLRTPRDAGDRASQGADVAQIGLLERTLACAGRLSSSCFEAFT